MRALFPLLAATLVAASFTACGGEQLVGQRVSEIRPTDGDGWAGNGYGDVTVESWDTPGGRFRIHYAVDGYDHVQLGDADNDGVPDFAQQFGLVFDQVLKRYRDELGFREPLSDELYHDRSDYGGDDRFDVYLKNQAGSSDGYLVTEACANTTPTTCAGYMVVENDFDEYSYSSDEVAMKILASHEFFHAVQSAYVRDLNQSFSEGTAVWGTEEVFPETSDFEGFIRIFFQQSHRPIDDVPSSPSDLYPYSTAIWPRFLSERFDAQIVPQLFDELASGSSASALDALDALLQRDYQSTMPVAFGEFALWNFFTGERAREGVGYANAAKYPEVSVIEKTDALPYRISGEIAYLSAAYYKLQASAQQELTVTVEYETPKPVLHLITGSLDDPTIVTSEPGAKSATIVTEGDVYLVVASTTRSDKHQALSLAVTIKAITDPINPPPPPDTKDSGGCALAGANTNDSASGLMLLLPLMLLLLMLLSRARRSRGLLGLALIATLSLGACSDDSEPAGDDGGIADTVLPDVGPDAETTLALGRFVEVPATTEGAIAIDVPVTGDEQFMLLLVSHAEEARIQQDYQVLQARAATLDTSPTPLDPLPGAGAKPRACDFHQRLQRVLQDAELPLKMPASYTPFADTKPVVGEVRSFEIQGRVGVETVQAEAVHVDDVAVFWLDKTTTVDGDKLAEIDSATLTELAQGFSEIIIPRERIFFGEESDVNGDGLISVMLSPLTGVDGATAYVSLCDLTDVGTIPGCQFSNGQEMIYLTPPNLIDPPYNTPRALLETAAHEFQHAIFFYRKYLLNQSTELKANPYITEGLSHLAQDLSGYQAGNLYVVMATLGDVDTVSLPNVLDAEIDAYVPRPADGVLRGGGYLVFRYLFDRAGGETMQPDGTPVDNGGITFLHTFIDQPEIGIEGALKASGLTYAEMVNDFWTAMAISNRKAGGELVTDDPRYSFLPTTVDPLTERQRGCDLFAPFHGMSLPGPTTQELSAADGKLRPGGAELLTLRPEEGASRLSITLQTDPASKAVARLIRIR